MEALEAILTRRSTRKYQPELPDQLLIEKVIEAGRYAPSGGNSQTTHFIIITKPDILDEIAWIVQTAFAKMQIQPNTYQSLQNSINASKRGNYIFHYNTPVLIVTANKKGYGNAMADSACALENMMIAANALDLGSCWINQLHWLDEDEAVREYFYGLGLEEDETVTGALALGYPADGLPNRKALPRTGNPVTWVMN
ncbi:MAG: nitroreductase family protein [Anaerolineaceae bacterium]|nr:nitroreductase family protein [Anaerolineaceae bacterium]